MLIQSMARASMQVGSPRGRQAISSSAWDGTWSCAKPNTKGAAASGKWWPLNRRPMIPGLGRSLRRGQTGRGHVSRTRGAEDNRVAEDTRTDSDLQNKWNCRLKRVLPCLYGVGFFALTSCIFAARQESCRTGGRRRHCRGSHARFRFFPPLNHQVRAREAV